MKNVIVLPAVAMVLAAGLVLEDCCAATEEAKPQAGNRATTPPPGRPMVPLGGDWSIQFVTDAAQVPGQEWETKPVKLPGVTRFPRSKEGVKQNGMWFERKVDVPPDWRGRRVALRVGRCMYGLGVYVNGKKAGEIPGYGGELDVTSLATPGQTATIRLYAGRLGQGLESLGQVSRSAAAYNAQKDPGRNWLAAPTGVFGRPEEFCLEGRPSDLFVKDVWYQTPVRGGARIEPLIRIWSAAARDGVVCRVAIYGPGEGKPVLTSDFPLGHLPAGNGERRLVLPAGALKLWGIREPNLYFGQVVLLDTEGKELDRSNPARFGVREFWAQGRKLYLNGQPVYPVPAFCGWTKTTGLDELVAAGVTMVQTGFPFWFRYFDSDYTPLAEACDERGLLFIPPGMTHHELSLSDPEMLQDYAVWARHYYRRYANHPSIVIYGLGINSPGNFVDFSPTKMGRTFNVDWNISQTTRSYLVSRRTDPTRLYYFHGGPRGGDIGSANFYPNHIPTQEVEDWPNEWAEKGDRPFLTLEGLLAPIDVDYRKNASYLIEYLAILGGGEAYAAETPSYRTYSTYEHRRLKFWGYKLRAEFNSLMLPQRCAAFWRTGRAWRFYGVPFNQWYGGQGTPHWRKDRVKDAWIKTGDALRRPSLAWIGGPENDFSLKDHNFYGGETVEKTVLGLRDQNGSSIWKIHWELKDRASSKPVAAGSFTHRLSAFARMKVPFRFLAPEVPAVTAFDLTLQVKEEEPGQSVATDNFPISVYPRPAAATPRKEIPFLIFDPEGETTAWLKSLGMPLESWQPGGAGPEGVLVVGRRALRGLKSVPYAAEDIEKGLRVVVLEQHCPELGKLGFRHEDRCPRQVFVRRPDHPLAAGLTTEALRDWRGHGSLISAGPFGDRLAVSGRLNHWGNRGTVASAIIETPHFGPFVPVLDGEFDLSYSPLLSWRHGKGEVLFCQLDLTGRIGREPAAGIFARNLIEYLRGPRPARVERTVACLDDTDAQAIEALGFEAKSVPPEADRHILVVTGSQREALAAQRDTASRFLEAGGDLLVLYADEPLLADPLFGKRVKAESVRVSSGPKLAADPLLRGVGPQNLHWRAPVDLLKITSSEKGFASLLDGLLCTLPQGKGRIVFFQLDPKRMANLAAVKELDPQKADPKAKPLPDNWYRTDRQRTSWHVSRLHSLLLANLGARSAAALAGRLFELKQTMPTAPLNEWVVLGPIPPWDGKNTDNGVDPLERKNLEELASHRDLAFEYRNERSERVHWVVPSDSNNGLGLEGKNDLGKIYGVHLKDLAIAVSHVWSTRAREAVIGIGADWFLRIDINGKEVFRTRRKPWTFGINFDRKLKVPLKAGWNEFVCYAGAGSNGHIFWFEITNPGDLAVAQQLQAPADPPAGIPPAEELIPDNIEPGFAFYTDPMTAALDPYAYVPW